MKIALFAAVPEEVGTLSNLTTFTGIGRENATRKTLQFIESQACKDFTIVNIGTVGSPNKPVGSILNYCCPIKIENGRKGFLTH